MVVKSTCNFVVKSSIFEDLMISKDWVNIKLTSMLSSCQLGCHIDFYVN